MWIKKQPAWRIQNSFSGTTCFSSGTIQGFVVESKIQSEFPCFFKMTINKGIQRLHLFLVLLVVFRCCRFMVPHHPHATGYWVPAAVIASAYFNHTDTWYISSIAQHSWFPVFGVLWLLCSSCWMHFDFPIWSQQGFDFGPLCLSLLLG